MSANSRSAVPWHLWIVGTLAIFLYGMGAYDFIMMMSENEAYFRMQEFGDRQIAYFRDYPFIPAMFWTAAVWVGLAASILLLMRSRWAVPGFAVSLIGQMLLFIYTFGLLDRWNALGAAFAIQDFIIFLLMIGFFLYSHALLSRNRLH